ncbi:efflux RND transporter periplasmic adaptor subunit [Vibrio sp. VB16]|uniref:efflux RND transporter periplasmic adaptor subunit n=1 Tax=Vibrio sp. VB16 TaxID=2785746 RepID=UPI00189E09E9|nr:HlyD family efflux transporter periplasmic adaptor subunit [Vibrio sp. VB16]UGA55131.1 HlyD family secretion protein [Vibrio sp. VB16]
MNINRKLLFFPVLAIGIVILFTAIKMKPDLSVKPAGDRARLVKVMPLELKAMAPIAIGFGKVAPKFEWKAIAEVTGKVVYRNPELEKGRILQAGTEVLRIDPLDYELKLAQAEADLSSSKTQLAKLNQEEKNLKGTVKIEKNRLSISQNELDRKLNLKKRGLTSQSDVDQQNQTYLSQQKLVQDMQNQLSLYPDERKVSQAQVKVNESKVTEAKRSLEKTSIVLPQDLRIAEVDIEDNQVVNLQQTMVTAHGTNTMEVEAQLSIHDLQLIASSLAHFINNDSGISQPDMSGIASWIELSSGSLTARWPAKVARISETVDATQATAGVILEIEQDYSTLNASNIPPLVNGMFVSAELVGQENPSWVIPERALHGDSVYIMDVDNKLDIRPVSVLYRRDNQVVIDGELEHGERLVLNDVLPALQGMLLKIEGAQSVPAEEDAA